MRGAERRRAHAPPRDVSRPVRNVRPTVAVLALLLFGLLMFGCRADEPTGVEGRVPTDWTKLPAVTTVDPELGPLGSRQDAYDRVCARNRGDSFAKVLCGGNRRPEIRDFAELYELVGLADQRVFALTGKVKRASGAGTSLLLLGLIMPAGAQLGVR